MKIFHTLFFLLFSYFLVGQINYDSNWTFGNSGGVKLSFNDESVSVQNIDLDFDINSGSSVISNKQGVLQFFSNGCEIKNRNYEVMLNGDSIGLPGNPFCSNGNFNPLVNSTVIVPSEINEEIYYNLHIGFTADATDTASLYLTTVDMSKDNGLGAVVEKKEFIFSDYFSRYGMEMTRHANGQDWWVIIPQFESNCYHTLLFDEGEFVYDTLQCIGQKWDHADVQYQHDFSPNGQRYARFSHKQGMNLLDFDSETGLFSEPIRIDFGFTEEFFHAGVIFSPNSRFVYASAFDNIFQFDLEALDVSESRIKIATLSTPDSIMFRTRFSRGFLAPNSKIYIGGTFQFNHLHVIHYPDCKGLDSNPEQYAIRLNEFPHFCSQGVPNIPHFRNQPQDINCDTVQITVSTQSPSKTERFKHTLSPNPSASEIEISISNITSNYTIEFYDLLGENMLTSESESAKKKIDVSSLPSGMFFYTITAKGQVIGQGKFFKVE